MAVDDLDRDQFFSTHPWALTAGGQELVDQIHQNCNSKLSQLVKNIGASAVTREDSAFMVGQGCLQRHRIPSEQQRPLVEGTALRDYSINEPVDSAWPYSEEDLTATAPSELNRMLWPTRRILRERTAFGKTQVDRGLAWFEYSMFFKSRYQVPSAIAVAFVATHNHFAASRPRDVFQHSALVLEPREDWNQETTHQLLAILNSSTACLWLKQSCHDKGHGGIGGGIASEEWEKFYEFNSTNLQNFPLPAAYPTYLSAELASLAQQISATTPAALAAAAAPTAQSLRGTQTRYASTRARMIALQEELDWQVYSLYKLHSEDLRLPDSDAVPELALGERAFEIVLARRVAAGEASGEWFKRHGSTPITEIPSHWPDDYRALVQKRIDVIESNRAIGMIERPEYKRRWATEGWDSMRQKALKSWLLDRIEDRSYWFDANGNPTITTLARLTEALSADEDFTSVADLYAPRQDFAKTVRDLLSEEHVPFVSALRYKPAALKKRADWEHVWDLQREEDAAPDEPAKRKIRERTPVPPKYTSADFLKPSYWRARGKLDVPKERFVSYGTVNAQSPELYGWAGWDHLEQGLALASYIQTAGLGNEEIVPFLAGLLELQPWLDQWYGEYDAEFGASPAAEILAFRQQKQGELGLSDDTLRAWRPAPAARAKKAAAPKKKAAASAESD
ncbi:BREX-2 system adenine-specific DNA-methyltransferase PglX [Streptomyces sp. Vc17.3-30]|uniref:BREX-2 system adenine-specific DNA-methyltransferase PglX n=1 Tax=Streptomyces sp. Vc17.3-30 TaxID=2841672 RepID=UPI0020958BAA|nr:BREX-2 system adenine-specific DNA-methyltransferase PglX [Streptomyces sp. Vc17.3-30]MCO6693733.1 BREX-2 system adenine-specific DNA-methyltransferase PglX [Streptomyces sp. Vc17.3-30]